MADEGAAEAEPASVAEEDAAGEARVAVCPTSPLMAQTISRTTVPTSTNPSTKLRETKEAGREVVDVGGRSTSFKPTHFPSKPANYV